MMFHCSEPEPSAALRLTVKPVDTHHKVYAVFKLLIVLLGGEVGQIWCQERKVAVQAGLKAQLFEQLLFGFVETGEKKNDIQNKTRDYILHVSNKLNKTFSSNVQRQANNAQS